MKIDERRIEDVVVLDLEGRLLLGEGDRELKEKVDGLVEAGEKKVALNLKGVPYVDSGGLGAIVRCYTTLSRNEGRLKLVNLNKRIRDLLSITRMLSFMGVDEDDGWPKID